VPGFAGFFSKDAILGAAWQAHIALWAVGTVTAGITAFYMFRLFFMTFHGKFRGTEEQHHHLHESPPSMTLPLVVLALGAVFAGWVGVIPFLGRDWLGHFLAPVIADVGHAHEHAEHGLALEAFLVGASVLVGLLGIFVAWRLYGGDRELAGEEALVRRAPGVHRVLANKYYVDELYQATVVRPLHWLARMCWKVIDTIFINGSVHVGAFVVELTGDLARFTTTGNVRNYALYFFAALVALFCWMVF